MSREGVWSSSQIPSVTAQATASGTQHSNGSTPSVQITTGIENKQVYDRGWENDMEALLKVGPAPMFYSIDSYHSSRIAGNVQRHQKPTDSPAFE